MPRYAAVENGVVVGVLQSEAPPSLNVPVGRTYVDVTEQPAIQGGERYDGTLFIPSTLDLATRVEQLEASVQTIEANSKGTL